MFFFSSILQGSTTVAPRNAYPGAVPPAPATIKGAQRPTMTSPAGITGAQYRGANWTQGYPPQQTYRYSAPLPQPTYAFATHQAQTTTVSLIYIIFYIDSFDSDWDHMTSKICIYIYDVNKFSDAHFFCVCFCL